MPEMTEQLLDEYVKAGIANNAQVLPAGLAPDINQLLQRVAWDTVQGFSR